MKAKKSLAMIMTVFAAAVAFSLASVPAYANEGDDLGTSDSFTAGAGFDQNDGPGDGNVISETATLGFETGDNGAGETNGPIDEVVVDEGDVGSGDANDGGSGSGGEGNVGIGEAGEDDEPNEVDVAGGLGAGSEGGTGPDEANGNGSGNGDGGDGPVANAGVNSGETGDVNLGGTNLAEGKGSENADVVENEDVNAAKAGSFDVEGDATLDGANTFILSSAVNSGGPMLMLAAGDNGQDTSNDGLQTTTSALDESNEVGADQVVLRSAKNASTTEGLGEDAELNIGLTLVEGALSGSASGSVSWASGKILTAIFGSSITGDVEQKLDEILQALAEIRNEIEELQKTVDAQELDNILNSMKNLIDSNKTPIIMTNLDSLNKAQYSPEEYEQRMRSALTEGMANGTLDSIGSIASPFNTFDNYASDLWIAMTTPYEVTINNQTQSLTLMQVYYEHLRLKYKWEHQAYEEWEAFNNRCVGLLAATLGLERASLKVRLDILREYNANHTDKHDEGAIIARLNETQDEINQMKGFTGTVNDESRDPKKPVAKKVDYPGLFNKKAWDEQYWMYKARPDFRYYWVPNHECLFYAQVNTQDIPYEDTSGSILVPGSFEGLKITTSGGSYHIDIAYNHWKPFLNYQGGDSPLASETQLKTMYKDYGSDTHLYNIFIDPDEGNFLGLDEGDIEHWWFVVGQTEDHHITLKESDGYNYELYTYVVSSPHAAQDTVDLARYNQYGAWWNSNRHYIGVGVVRYGPETYDPKKSAFIGDDELAKAEVHTTILYSSSIWWPSYGNLLLGYGEDSHGAVERVLMDGVELDDSCYSILNGRIVLNQAYLASLGYGEHELFLDTEEGGHTVVFGTQADGVYYLVSGANSSWTPGDDSGLTFVFKRTVDDAQTFYRLIDVLVDGIPVPAWGYIASAGSAIITLTPAFLATLEPGVHVLTAVFADGNNPQATFTVHAAQTQAVPASYTPENAVANQTPVTGDGYSMLIVLLAVTALVSSFVVAFASRRTRAQ